MANRAMQAKFRRAQAERRMAGAIEGSKPLNRRHETIAAADRIRAETDAMIATFRAGGGKVVRCVPGKAMPAVGKGRRTYETTTYGNGRRLGAAVVWADWQGGLIPGRG